MNNIDSFKTFLRNAAQAAATSNAVLIFGSGNNTVSTTAFPGKTGKFTVVSFHSGEHTQYNGKADKTKKYVGTRCIGEVIPVKEDGTPGTPVRIPLPVDFFAFIAANELPADSIFTGDIEPVTGYPNIRQFTGIKFGERPATLSLPKAVEVFGLVAKEPATTELKY